MGGNLRDRGYPSAKQYVPNKSDKKDTLMRADDVSAPSPALATTYGEMRPANQNRENLINRLISAYNSRAFGNQNAPLVHRSGTPYVTDDTDERAYFTTTDLRDHGNNRLAFASKNVTPSSAGYYAGIDNLSPIFGDNYATKDIATPIGNLNLEYDGDTASVGLELDNQNRYIQALANLLGR